MQRKPQLSPSLIFGRKQSPKYVESKSDSTVGVLAVDVGGTKISGAIIDREYKILFLKTVSSRETVLGIADPNLAKTRSLIATLMKYAEVHKIDLIGGAAGFPEYVNLDGILTSHDNIDWRIQPKEDFPESTKIPWVIQSDVRCAGVAEAMLGSGRRQKDFVYITVSSGISHTHFVDGLAISGETGEAIGFGLLEIDVSGVALPLENYCSGLGIARRFANFTGDDTLDARAVLALFETNPIAREIVESSATVLGREIASLAKSLPTRLFVIGGGLWLGSQKYRELVISSFDENCVSLGIEARITSAAIEHAGLLGAAFYAFKNLE